MKNDEMGCCLVNCSYVHLLNIDQLDCNIPVFGFMIVLTDDFKNIIIDKIAVAAINGQVAITIPPITAYDLSQSAEL